MEKEKQKTSSTTVGDGSSGGHATIYWWHIQWFDLLKLQDKPSYDINEKEKE